MAERYRIAGLRLDAFDKSAFLFSLVAGEPGGTEGGGGDERVWGRGYALAFSPPRILMQG
jgi:hypothetical protein